MNKTFEQLYYLKALYFNAGKNMLTDNFKYYKNLVINTKILSVVDKILHSHQSAVLLADDTGCRANRVLERLADICQPQGDVFIITDDSCTGKLAGVILPGNLFVIHSFYYLASNLPVFNLKGCYRPGQRRKYTSRQYVNIAKYYFEKSEYIEKKCSL